MKLLKQIALPLTLLVLWHCGSAAGWWNAYILPSPARVWRALCQMTVSGELMAGLRVSVRRVVVGFSISFALALALGVVSAWFKRGEWFSAVVEFLRHVPPLGLVPLLILWFGIGERSKTVLICLATFFPIYLSIHKGFAGADKRLLEVGRTLGFTNWQLFRRIVMPCAVPDILVGLRIGIGYSWRAIIGAEMIAASSGLGYLILDAQQMSRSERVVAGIFVIGAVGLISDKLLALLVKRAAPGAGGENVG